MRGSFKIDLRKKESGGYCIFCTEWLCPLACGNHAPAPWRHFLPQVARPGSRREARPGQPAAAAGLVAGAEGPVEAARSPRGGGHVGGWGAQGGRTRCCGGGGGSTGSARTETERPPPPLSCQGFLCFPGKVRVFQARWPRSRQSQELGRPQQ